VFLEKKGAPVRHFVLVDLSGSLENIIEQALEQEYQRGVLQALNAYARQNALRDPAIADRPLWEQFGDENAETVAAFLRAGGKESYLRELGRVIRAGAPQFAEPRRLFQRVTVPMGKPDSLSSVAEELRPYLRGDKQVDAAGIQVRLDAAILIPRQIEEQIVRPGARPGNAGPIGIQYWSGNLAEKNLRSQIERAVNQEIRRRESVDRGLDLALYQQIDKTHIPVVELNPKKEAGQERVSKAETLAQWAPVAFVYLLWVALFSISQMLLTNMIEEKSNRIIEVLLSSVTPAELLLGKLSGIAAVGLTMVLTWVFSLLAVVSWKVSGNSELGAQFLLLLRGSHLIPAFIIYFILAYLLYAGIILAIGSVCNTLKEAQNYMGVITLLMMVPLFTMMFIPKDPNGTVATILSWVPIYTPFLMMNRASADPPLFDVIGTMILLSATTAVVLWSAVKIFRVGILRTGQPPRILEMLRWLRMR
jgi:ABC-2 type transport system permease protein